MRGDLGDEGEADSGVGFDELEEDLSADVLEKIFDVIPDEWVIHYCLSITLIGMISGLISD